MLPNKLTARTESANAITQKENRNTLELNLIYVKHFHSRGESMRCLLSILAIAAAFFPGEAAAQKVRVDYEHGNDFAKYKTYKWVKISDNAEVNQLVDQRVVTAIDAAMTKEGLAKAESNPDLFIGYQASIKQQHQLTTFTDGMGPGWGYGAGWGYGWGMGGSSMSTTTTSTINTGTLVVDLMDPHLKKLVFRGIASDTLSDKPEKNAKKIQKAVTKLFEKYPPKDK